MGETVEVRLPGKPPLSGLVDSAMANNSVLWLAPHGVDARKMVEATEGYVVWLDPQQYFERCHPYEQGPPYFMALPEPEN